MRFFKYFKPILLFLIYEAFWIILALIINIYFSSSLNFDLSYFIPTQYLVSELIINVTIFIPLGGLLGYLIGGYLLAPLFLFFHKLLYGKKLEYGIQYKPPAEKINIISKGFFPLMLAINLSFSLSTEEILAFVLSASAKSNLNIIAGADTLIKPIGLSILLPVCFAISMFLFSSIWFLKNSGIIYSNEKSVKDVTEPFVVRSVGGWMHTLIKGYAGIGVVVTYFQIIYEIVVAFSEELDSLILVVVVLMWTVLLFILFLATIPSLIFNEIIRNKSGDFVRNIGVKLEIVDEAIITFELREQVKEERAKELLERLERPKDEDKDNEAPKKMNGFNFSHPEEK